jgi:hypothetical protein
MIFRLDSSPTELWRGCVLATIAHAIFTVHSPELANEQSWDGVNYSIQDSQGSLGTVTFAKVGTVAAFFDSHSRRSPFSSEEEYDLSARLAEMPADLSALAESEALQYLIQEYHGTDVPVITTVFWSEAGQLVAAEPWQDVFSNGGHLVRTQLQAIDKAIDVWRAHYALTAAQVELLGTLFARKLSAGEGQIALVNREKKVLLEQGSEGLEQSRDILAGLAITVP